MEYFSIFSSDSGNLKDRAISESPIRFPRLVRPKANLNYQTAISVLEEEAALQERDQLSSIC